MPDLNNTSLVSFKDWTLRIREATDRFDSAQGATQREPAPRLMLLIHGLTGDENSMWVFARDLSPAYWIVAPRALHPAKQGGYSWRLPQFKRSTTAPHAVGGGPADENLDQLSLAQLRSAAAALIHLVDEYSLSVGLDASVFDVMGFSQGAGMSNLLAFLYPERIGKVGILAGFVPSGLEELVSGRPLAGKPFFVVHGTKDQMVSIDIARSSVKTLERAGAQVTYCEDEVGHKVSVTCLRSLQKFFANTRSGAVH